MTPDRHTDLDASAVTSMPEIRASIDDLDRQIVTLLAERMRFIEAAARIKPNREAVHDQWRVDDVLTKVVKKAEEVHFPKELILVLYKRLVGASIKHEFETYDGHRARDGIKPRL